MASRRSWSPPAPRRASRARASSRRAWATPCRASAARGDRKALPSVLLNLARSCGNYTRGEAHCTQRMAWQKACCGAKAISPCAAWVPYLLIVVRNGARRAAVVRAGGELSGIFGFAAAPVRCISNASVSHAVRRLTFHCWQGIGAAPRRRRPVHRCTGAIANGARRACSCAAPACRSNISHRSGSSRARRRY